MAEPANQPIPDRGTRVLRLLCLLYLFLLVVEGALRKWVFPSLSDALLLVRDPIVLYAYFQALVRGRFPHNNFVIFGFVLISLWVAVTLFIGHGNLIVAGFGFRTNFFHFPMAFIMGTVFYRRDVIELGKWWLLGTIGMTGIIAMQFYMPQSAWINQGVGGVEGAGFSGAMGRYRPPGTFSFIVGVVWYYVFATAFLVGGITQHKRYPKWLITTSAIAIIIAIPVSISRSLILAAALTFVTGLLVSGLQRNALRRYGRIFVFAVIGLIVAAQFPVFDEAKEAFFSRWEHSTRDDLGGVKGAIVGRIINDFIGPFVDDNEIPILGVGIGAGTQVGNKLLRGSRDFQLGEGEWFRITAEGGIIFGSLYILWRILLTCTLLKYSMRSYLGGNGLGLIFLSATAFNLLVGQIGQSTILGFTIMGIGLTVASMRERKSINLSSDEGQSDKAPASPCESS
ncbi:hypothetical protein DDZ13_06665 [Coraliomargarita sinensis]|uniref:O-antigen ligase domain-containing protein n=1 Tax=Coraliomargarita sinensis TaxID=2174842 RepID=A0A317ZIZ8_9BACT|nr:hypothetical protein [Coraliomargarita sinensis]PXA04217.1 hypothetical protein DDZ13_06665 [Coraliomargarita sinensis]